MRAAFLCSVAAGPLLIWSSAASAQDVVTTSTAAATALQTGAPADDSAPVTAEPASSEGLEDIVVTAQRRAENLQRAAVAVSSVGGDLLQSASIVSPTQLTAVVPALQIAPSNSSFNFYLRGVGNVNGNALSESAIAFNFGGVYVGRPASTAAYFYDLERVEVLKGPQGTLYGRNATGGAINLIPKAPDYEFGGTLTAEYGNYDTLNLQGAINLPLSDKAAVRASGFVARHDGYLKDGTDDQKDYGGRLQAVFEPGDNLKIALLADYAHQGGRGGGATPVALGVNRRDGISSPAGQAFYESQVHSLGGRNFVGIPSVQYQDNDFFGVSATVDLKTDIGTFTIIPAYRRSEIDARSSTVGFVITEKDVTKEKSVEARFASEDLGPVKILVGGYYYDSDIVSPLFRVNNQFDLVSQNFRTGTSSQALFGRLTYEIDPSFRVTGGVRYTHEKKYLEGNHLSLTRVCLGGFGACPTAQPFDFLDSNPAVTVLPDGTVLPEVRPDGTIQVGSLIPRDLSVKFNRVTWRVGADWDVGPNSLLYASYETGFKSGGFFFTHDEGIYRPENIRAWTLGSKNRFFDNRVQLNLEAFYWTYKDQQISHVALDSQGTAVLPTENIGKATIRGIEAEAKFLATETTLLGVDFQYLDAKYDDFTYSVPNFGAPPYTTCPAVLAGVNYTVDCSGRRPPQAPKFTVNLSAEQTIPLPSDAEIKLTGRLHYQSTTLTSLEFVPEEYQSGYTTLDASVMYKSAGGRFSIGAFANNLTNRTVKAGTFIPPFSITGFAVALLRPPRTYGIRVGLDF